MSKKVIGIVIVVVVLAVAGAVGYFARRDRSSAIAATETQAKVRVERPLEGRDARLAELAKERGGLPIDQALREVTTQAAKDFIQKDMAYQRQTRAEAANEAQARLSEVKSQLSGSTDEKKVAALLKQAEMLEELAERLSK